MDCPRCGGHVTVFELEGAVSQVCEDCSYVGVVADHRPEGMDVEPWDDALSRLQTEFPESTPDGVARVDDDAAPPEALQGDEPTAEDSGFQFKGSPDSTTVAESGPEPGTDFPVGEASPERLSSDDRTVVTTAAEPEPESDAETQVATGDDAAESDAAESDSTENDTAEDGTDEDGVEEGSPDEQEPETDGETVEADDADDVTEAEDGPAATESEQAESAPAEETEAAEGDEATADGES